MLFLRQKIVINFPKNWVFQKIIGVPKFCCKISGEFCSGAFCELLQGLEVQNKSNTMRTPLWPLGKEFRWFQRVVHTKLSIWRHDRSFNQIFWTVLAWSQKSKQFGAYSIGRIQFTDKGPVIFTSYYDLMGCQMKDMVIIFPMLPCGLLLVKWCGHNSSK